MPEPSELEPEGYEDLRAYAVSEDGWSHVALIDDEGNEETRIDIHDDGRAAWSDAEENPIVLTIEIEGSDADLETPVELSESALYPDDESDDALHVDDLHDGDGEPSNAIIGGNDELVIEHSIELPEDE